MRDTLAERLLAEVMGWGAEEVARERPRLQAIGAYKYDEYQQFSPGMRFVESLAVWLIQFGSPGEKRIAYEFVMRRLIFCSTAEMNHLVTVAHHDYIRPRLLRQAARDTGIDERHVSKIANSLAFKLRLRQCLFLGLSDGARTDVFRRANPELSHEQVLQTYEVASERIDDLLGALQEDVSRLNGVQHAGEPHKFRSIVLLDDFSASGISYLRRESGNRFKGKIGKFLTRIADRDHDLARLVDRDQVDVFVLLYMATDQARTYIEHAGRELATHAGIVCTLDVVQVLPREIQLRAGDGEEIHALIEKYNDPALHDKHMKKGGTTDAKYGFAACGLPLILSHNTPNNSLPLLWAPEGSAVRGLFPRVSRHKEA